MNKFDSSSRDTSNSIYNFTATESLNANFRAFDLEGGNFLLLAGSIPICIIVAVVLWILFRIVSFCTVKNYKKKRCRELGVRLKLNGFLVTMLRLFIQCYFEIWLSFLISVRVYNRGGYDRNTDDMTSFAFMLLFTASLLLLPIIMVFITVFNRNRLDDMEFQRQY